MKERRLSRHASRYFVFFCLAALSRTFFASTVDWYDGASVSITLTSRTQVSARFQSP